MVDRPRRTQRERTELTRAALLSAGRRLFGMEGYASVGTERVAREAGLTRGALYHQFPDKSALFAAVLDQVEAEIADRMVTAVSGGLDPADTIALLLAGADAFLDACTEPDIQRIVLVDGPSVLGWERWRQICLNHSVGLVAGLLADGIQRGTIPIQPVDPLTHVLVGAIDEAALYLARAADPAKARTDVNLVLRRLAAALTLPS
ncbi:MAG TPA: TetR/AcrR family transcriptional regulator [Kineosporiaceae bacterium]|nr:TetR/AcrR family transcriptional regulator [Kineosporiaceae bacterium]